MNSEIVLQRLCIVSSYEFADTNATKARVAAYLDVLSRHFEIAFFCPGGGVFPAHGTVKVIDAGRVPARGGFVLRAAREILYALKVMKRVWSIKPDAVLVTIPSMFLMLFAYWKVSPIVLDIRDLTWEYLPDRRVFDRVAKCVLRFFAKCAVLRADLVLVTNQHEYDYVCGVVSRKGNVPVRIVRNGISESRFDILQAIPNMRGGESSSLLYVGNVGIAQNLTTLVDAAIALPELDVAIVGEGRDLHRVKAYAENNNAKNVRFYGGLAWDKLVDHYATADILYAQILAEYESAIPSKLYEYLAVGIPIVYGGQGVAANFLSGFENVEVVAPEDARELVSAIKRLRNQAKGSRATSNIELIRNNFQREREVAKVVCDILRVAER